ncbi:hypothetical protein [Emticicia sp. 17c]
MKKQEFFESKFFKFLLTLSIIVSIISIFRAGYATGQWLFAILH